MASENSTVVYDRKWIAPLNNEHGRCHQGCECHLDELFVIVDGFQEAADIVGDLGTASLFASDGPPQHGSPKGKLVVDDVE
jgi:hypothetical protein